MTSRQEAVGEDFLPTSTQWIWLNGGKNKYPRGAEQGTLGDEIEPSAK